MRYLAVVTYDGSGYYGWQSQLDVPNIQDTIENALTTIHKHPVSIIASGRTDRGVHALKQVFHFDSELALTQDTWVKAINANLPMDIRILQVREVDPSFHARFQTKTKRYDYWLNMGAYDLFKRNYVTQYNRVLDVDKMREAIPVFLGTHDFTSFSGNSLIETPNQVRTIKELSIKEQKNLLQFIFVGDGFLRYMVRMIVGTLIQIGEGKLSAEEAESMLQAKSKEVCRYKARAEGLYLTEVLYEEENDQLSEV